MPDTEPAWSLPLLSATIIPLLFAITLHEVAHGWVARYFGDRTAEMLGRLTPNPLRHIDPMGSIAVPLLLSVLPNAPLFGWAKPVPVNTRNLRKPKQHMVFVAAAGPASNLVMALGWALLSAVLLNWPGPIASGRAWVIYMAQFGIHVNILLAIFNLMPIPPLDGGRVLRGLVPEGLGRQFDAIEPYGLILVMALLAAGVLGQVVMPLVDLLSGPFYSIARL